MVSYNTLLSDFNHVLAREDGFVVNRACNRMQHELLDIQYDEKNYTVAIMPYIINAYTYEVDDPFWYRIPGYGEVRYEYFSAHFLKFFRDLCYFWQDNDQKDHLYLAMQISTEQTLSLTWRNREEDFFDFQTHLYIYSDSLELTHSIAPEHRRVYFKNLKLQSFAGMYNFFDSCYVSTSTGLLYLPLGCIAYNCTIDYDLSYRHVIEAMICENAKYMCNCTINIHGEPFEYMEYLNIGSVEVLYNCKITFDIKKRMPRFAGGGFKALIGLQMDIPRASNAWEFPYPLAADIIKNCRLSYDIDLGETTGVGHQYYDIWCLASCKKLINSQISLKLRCCLVLAANKEKDYWGEYPGVYNLRAIPCRVFDEAINSENNLDFEYSIKIIKSENPKKVNGWYKLHIQRNKDEYFREIMFENGVITLDTGEVKV